MNIFLTGGTGFIGSHFINHAHKANHTIYAIRRSNSVPRVSLNKDPFWITGDLDGNYSGYLKECQIFVHLAAYSVLVPHENLVECIYWNVSAPLRLLDQAKRAGIERYIVAGSCSEYGLSALNYERIPPEAPLLPTDTYSTSKAAASIAFYGWATTQKTNLKILRIFQAYGEGEAETRFYPSLKCAAFAGEDFAMTEGQQRRDFIHVSEVADRFVAELNFEHDQFMQPFIDNVGTGHGQTLREFAEFWWKEWNAKGKLLFGELPYRENEVMRYIPLIKKGKE